MLIVKCNVSSVPVGPLSERNKFHACFSLTKGLRSKQQGNQLWRLWWHSPCAMRGNMKLETPAVFCVRWKCVTLTESWGDRTCSVVVIWTRISWQLAEHPCCDKTRKGRKHARGEKRRDESSLLLFLSRVSSVPRSVLSRAACSIVSAFIDRHAHSRYAEDCRCFKFKITAQCKFNMKHRIKQTEEYHRRHAELSSRCQNVRLCYPYLQYTNLFIFRFVSEQSLRSKLIFTTMFIL